VVNEEELAEIDNKFGPEPFSNTLNSEYLVKRAARMPQKTVKQFIMDQEILAGVGNIYADEYLFLAGILPVSKVKSLKEPDWDKLISAIRKVLNMGIKYGGTTDSDYVNAEGKKGGMQFHLNVYHRAGEPCPNGCKGVVEKTKIGGRGTYFCRSCQKELK
jgi:formamidopyrimidine-DNA glycosylase